MHFSTSAALVLLPALGSATSYLRSSGNRNLASGDFVYHHPHNKDNAGYHDGVNDCGNTNFNELTQPEGFAPTVDDCRDMLKLIVEDQEWIIDQEGETLVSWKSCAFNARVPRDQPEGSIGYLGNADVEDLVTDAIKRYERPEGTVGQKGCRGDVILYVNAAGGMPCDSDSFEDGHQVQVDWTLTHSGEISRGPYGNGRGNSGNQAPGY